MSVALALLVGAAAGLHIATWGMFKDSPHEGFSWLRYCRSPVVAMCAALVIQTFARLDLTAAAGAAVLFGATYAAERALIEFWKTFLREEDQSKYAIPMQFAVKGRLVQDRTARVTTGMGVAAAALLLTAAIFRLDLQAMPDPPLTLLLVGSAGGWFSAVGGAWKDAPFEGFETLKFFRSPLLAGGYALLLGQLTGALLLVAMGALGYTIATLETWKTFAFPGTPRGKFAGKPILYPEQLQRRLRFVPLYVLIWAAVIVAFVAALL